MRNDEKMSIDERRKYLKLVAPRYSQSNKAGRSGILTEMEAVTGLHRKSLIRLMGMPTLERAPKKPRFKRRRYGSAVADAVRVVWESLDYVCAERLTPALLRGAVAAGDYIHTLQLVDIATGWSERVAVLGRSQEAMVKGFQKVQQRLPFSIKQLHPDNGSEFFNDHLIRYFGEEITGMRLSRSRTYHKNDNRFVEQKNSTLVRDYVGYDRLDTRAQCDALNALYDELWLYYNLFQPVMHLIGKEVIGGRLQRKHDKAKTPYQRLLSSHILSHKEETRLAMLYSQTNPCQLRRDIYKAIEHLWNSPGSFNKSSRKKVALPQ